MYSFEKLVNALGIEADLFFAKVSSHDGDGEKEE
jgi:hypothetical protein